MRFIVGLSALVFMASRSPAGTIDPIPVDVTHATAQWLYPQDKLLFTISDWSYQVHAQEHGVSTIPAHTTFQFLSLPQIGPGEFTAWWEAEDGSVVADFSGTLSWLTGRYQSSGYTGPVSVLYGSMDLSPGGGTPAVLVIENLGGPVKLGLPPYRLSQDLSVSFSGGGFGGVSGTVTQVRYLDPPPAPEPDSGWILLTAGAVLCATSRVVKRIAGRGI